MKTNHNKRLRSYILGALLLCLGLLAACSEPAETSLTEGWVETENLSAQARLDYDVCLFEDVDYVGAAVCGNLANVARGNMPAGWNDRASSVQVRPSYALTLYEDINFAGGSIRFQADEPNLAARNFNNLTSSLEISRADNPTNPAPNPPTTPNPAPNPTTPDPDLPPPAQGERLNMRVLNETNGQYSDDQVYWAILGYDPATNALSYLNADGNLVAASPDDNGALTKNGKGYSNYFNRVSDVSSFTIPKMFGARIFLSVGTPMYIEILGVPGGVGFAGPDINNPADPNQDVFFDFGEFTYNDIGYFGNNTRVDQFGFPVRMRLVGDGGAYDESIGENVSREQIFNDFANIPQTEFRPLVKAPYRIVAPKAGGFGTGGSQTNYFDSYIDQIWNEYRNRDLVLTNDAGVFTGRVQGDNFVFSQEGGPSGLTIGRPNSVMVFEANGVFDTGSSLEKVIGAQLAAAINRHVVIDVDPINWDDDSLYYQDAPANFYANFWHERSINGKAYGFAYDDVFSKATLLQNQNPQQVDFIVGW